MAMMGLAGHADAFGQLCLRHLIVGEPQRTYGVPNPVGLLMVDGYSPRR
jgi:hypothetical protein